MRVMIADDQHQVRSAVKLLLEQEPELTVVGEAADADALLARMPALRPDLLLLDWELPPAKWRCCPPGPGEKLLSTVRSLAPDILVVVLSVRPESRPVALAAGVDGFVSKGEPPERLLDTVRALALKHFR